MIRFQGKKVQWTKKKSLTCGLTACKSDLRPAESSV